MTKINVNIIKTEISVFFESKKKKVNKNSKIL